MKLSSFYVTCNIHLIRFLESSVNSTAINQTLSYDKLSCDKTSSSQRFLYCCAFDVIHLQSCISPFHFGGKVRGAADFWLAIAALADKCFVLDNYERSCCH